MCEEGRKGEEEGGGQVLNDCGRSYVLYLVVGGGDSGFVLSRYTVRPDGRTHSNICLVLHMYHFCACLVNRYSL